MTQQTVKLPTNPDGSGDIMGIYGHMFSQLQSNGKVFMVEGHLPTIHRLVHQPYVSEALKRGAQVDILYTGNSPSTPEERQMMEDITNVIVQDRIDSLSPRDRIELMSSDMFVVYKQGGVESLAQHLTKALFRDNKPIPYKDARQLAGLFENDVKAGRIK